MRVKSSLPLACWNSSLNVGLLQTAVIATYIKNISCPQDMTGFESISALCCLCRYVGERFFHFCSVFGEGFLAAILPYA